MATINCERVVISRNTFFVSVTGGGSKMEVDDGTEESVKMETDDNEPPEPQLAQLWSQLFRVMDDVHEGTRLAADGTAKVLSKVNLKLKPEIRL